MMKRTREHRTRRAPVCVWLLAAAAACLSSAPPAAPVRWFDPLPAAPEATAPTGPVDLRVTQAPHLGREFLIRVGERELTIDGLHAWIAPPRDLVAAALAQQLSPATPDARRVEVAVEVFELDVREEPRAVVRLIVHSGGARHTVTARIAASDRSPEALATAMAGALAQASRDVAGIAGAGADAGDGKR